MPVGMDVYLGAGHIVLDGDRAVQLPRKGHSSPPLFSPCLLRPNGRRCQLLLSTCFRMVIVTTANNYTYTYS